MFYKEVFNPEIVLKMVFPTEDASGAVLGKIKFYVFTFVYYKLSQINKF